MFRRDPVADGKTGPVVAVTAAATAMMGKGNDDDKKHESKVWIAGAVIGPIIFLALFGLGFFLLGRRRRKRAILAEQDNSKAPPYSEVESNGHSSEEKSASVAHLESHRDAKYGVPLNSVELEHTPSPIAEMDERQGPMPELSDTQRARPIYELEAPPPTTEIPGIRVVTDTAEESEAKDLQQTPVAAEGSDSPHPNNETEATGATGATGATDSTEASRATETHGTPAVTDSGEGPNDNDAPPESDAIEASKGSGDPEAPSDIAAAEEPKTTDAPETPIMNSATEAPKRTDELFLESGDEKS